MDEKFYYTYDKKCPYCNKDKLVEIGESKYSGLILRCQNCGKIVLEEDINEIRKDKNENKNM